MSNRIIVLGDINVDVLMPISHYPLPGQEAMSRERVTRLGGSAANTAVVLSQLGRPVWLVARAGTDAWGDLALDTLRANGVEMAAIQRDSAHPTGLTFIPALPNGDHVLYCSRGANDYTTPEGLEAALVKDAALVHLSGYALSHAPQRQAAARLVSLAVENGIPLALDTALEPALLLRDEMRRLLPQLTLVVLGPQEAHALTGAETAEQAIDALLRAGIRRVGYKMGSEGCLVAGPEGIHHQPALPVATVDTTGAGDAFSAGLIESWLRGLDLPAAALLASALGALATTVWGGGSALPGRAGLVQFLRGLPYEPDRADAQARVLAALEDSYS